MDLPHISVLPNEVTEAFKSLEDGVFIDCTLGFAGHSQMILKNHPNIELIGFDRDINALEFSKKRLSEYEKRVRFFHGAFSQGIKEFKDENIKGILADIGVSSYQLDEQTRGFGFKSNSLDMRMDQSQSLSAKEVINGYTEEDLGEILREYGQISRWREIAREIVKCRRKTSIETPEDLIKIVGEKKERGRKVSIATLVFQAVRIEVNDELGELNRLLETIEEIKPSGALVGIITFHSLEDKIVKRTFKMWEKSCICPPDAFRCTCGNDHNLGKILTKKPLSAQKDEIKQNPRARSAKLRVFQFGN